jgi:hypothetical protein
MEIIFQGKHTVEEAAETLLSVLRLFRDRYSITQFREMHLKITLVNAKGEDVELIDNDSDEVYRTFQIYRQGHELSTGRPVAPAIQLVVDNTQSKS